MKLIWSYLLVLLIIIMVTVQSATHQGVCPPWFIPDNSSSTGCSSQDSYAKEVKCGVEFSQLVTDLSTCLSGSYPGERSQVHKIMNNKIVSNCIVAIA